MHTHTHTLIIKFIIAHKEQLYTLPLKSVDQ